VQELHVYTRAMDAAMVIFALSKRFPVEERYSLTDQVRRSSRSVCANIGEAWRKRRYPAAFVAKLSDAEAEASETVVWLEFARRCGYVEASETMRLDDEYDHIIAQLVRMIEEPEKWTIPARPAAPPAPRDR
jgi:four helix bundle protein